MPTPKEIKDRQKIDKIWRKFRSDMENGHEVYTHRAKYLEDMYLGAGRQWTADENIKEELEASGKPVIELNLIGADIRRLLGYQTQSRLNIAYKPRGDGDLETAEVLSKIALFELD